MIIIPRIIFTPGANTPHILWQYNFYQLYHSKEHIVSHYIILSVINAATSTIIAIRTIYNIGIQ